ncbi:MAG: alpha-isopropylmalate synthase regulatory domain-containing protein, partial [Pseudomonadota bacterium]
DTPLINGTRDWPIRYRKRSRPQADVHVRLKGEGIMATGRSSDPDTLVAAAKAYIHALNKLEARRLKRKAA